MECESEIRYCLLIRNYFLPTALTALSSCQQLLNASNYVELDQTFINRSSQPGVSARGSTPSNDKRKNDLEKLNL